MNKFNNSKSCSSNDGAKTISLRVPLELYDELTYVCHELDLNRGEIIRELLHDSIPLVSKFAQKHNIFGMSKSECLKLFSHKELIEIKELIEKENML